MRKDPRPRGPWRRPNEQRKRRDSVSQQVNGLVSKDFDKLNDVSFLNCIKNLDIVGLVETHTTSSFISPLDDNKIFHTLCPK